MPGVGSDIKAEGIEELVYPEVPVPPLASFMAIMRVTDDLLSAITCPALILQSNEDHVVPPPNSPHILERLGNQDKQLVWLENSYHVATLDNDKELIAELRCALSVSTGAKGPVSHRLLRRWTATGA